MTDLQQQRLAERDDRTAGSPKVEFRDVSTSFDGHETLSRVSLTAPAGRITVLMGASRSGKSLVVRHLLGQLTPGHGSVLIDGQPMWEFDDEHRGALRGQISVLRCGSSIHESEWRDSQSVIENLSRVIAAGRESSPVRRWVQDCLLEFDLEHLAHAKPRDLDAAARRRLGLALALIGSTRLVVIDDPRSGIDVPHLSQIVSAIRRHQARSGATPVLTTHSLEVARRIAHHVVVLSHGMVVAAGTPEQLLGDVYDGYEFQRRFRSALSVREADPERLRREAGESGLLKYLGRGLAQQGQIIAFAFVAVIFMLLLTGVVPLLPR